MSDEERTARVFKVIGERGYVSGEDLMQLTDIGHPVYARLAERLNITPEGVRDLVAGRKLEAEDVRAVVAG